MTAKDTDEASWIGGRCRSILATAAFIFAVAGAALAAETRVFEGVSPAVLECVKATSEREHGTVYEPRDGDRGVATTKALLWSVSLAYARDQAGMLTYELLHRTFFVPVRAIWSGIAEMVALCRQAGV